VAACSGSETFSQLPGLAQGFEPLVLDREKALKGWLYNWHTVCSVLRRELWLEHRFNELLPSTEDNEWAFRLAKQGWRIIVGVPAIVKHRRHMTSDSWVKRLQKRYWARFAGGLILQATIRRSTLRSVLAGCALDGIKLLLGSSKDIVKLWIERVYFWDASRLAQRALSGNRPPRLLSLRPPRPDGQPRELGFRNGAYKQSAESGMWQTAFDEPDAQGHKR